MPHLLYIYIYIYICVCVCVCVCMFFILFYSLFIIPGVARKSNWCNVGRGSKSLRYTDLDVTGD